MKAPIGWLKDFTDIEVSPKELADAMTLSGSKVEEIISDNISGVYAAQILSIEDHPDSDHLHILKVDFGTDELGRSVQIVCGAPNVEIGMICPAAAVGAHLPEIDIKKGKIRGVESFGMCCSGEELGALAAGKPGADVYGLWDLRLLPEVPALGTDINDILNSEDLITIDFEITSNRPDCFSIEGLGREAAVTLGKPFNGVTLKIDKDDNILVSCTALIKGFINDERKYDRRKIDWYNTNDKGFIEDGVLYYCGKYNYYITYKGERYYNHEIEQYVTVSCPEIKKCAIVQKRNRITLFLTEKVDEAKVSTILAQKYDFKVKYRYTPAIPHDTRHHTKTDYKQLLKIA